MNKTVISGGVVIIGLVLLILLLRNRAASGNNTPFPFPVGSYIQLKNGTGKIWLITGIENGNIYALVAADNSATTAWNKSYVESEFKIVRYP
jgi:hypothetical protein